jgi:hypothetical protein
MYTCAVRSTLPNHPADRQRKRLTCRSGLHRVQCQSLGCTGNGDVEVLRWLKGQQTVMGVCAKHALVMVVFC